MRCAAWSYGHARKPCLEEELPLCTRHTKTRDDSATSIEVVPHLHLTPLRRSLAEARSAKVGLKRCNLYRGFAYVCLSLYHTAIQIPASTPPFRRFAPSWRGFHTGYRLSAIYGSVMFCADKPAIFSANQRRRRGRAEGPTLCVRPCESLEEELLLQTSEMLWIREITDSSQNRQQIKQIQRVKTN